MKRSSPHSRNPRKSDIWMPCPTLILILIKMAKFSIGFLLKKRGSFGIHQLAKITSVTGNQWSSLNFHIWHANSEREGL